LFLIRIITGVSAQIQIVTISPYIAVVVGLVNSFGNFLNLDVGVFNTTHTLLYLDGVELSNSACNFASGLDSSAWNKNEIYIGMRANETYYPYNGSIDEVKIYNRVLTQAEVGDLE